MFDPIAIGLGDQFHGLTKQIKNAMKEKYRYICLYFSVIFTNNRGGHVNIVLYDTKNKVIELFEPHGGFKVFLEIRMDIIKIRVLYIQKT